MNKIAVVILNWNGKKLLEQFLPSVTQFSNREWAEVIVADNASSDDSLDFLKAEYPSLKTIVLDKNYGFADGYNKALDQLDHDYFVLLNSDVEVSENWLDPIYDLFEKENDIVAAQPKIKAYNNKSEFEYAGASGGYIDHLGYPFCRGRVFDTMEPDTGQYDQLTDVMWASGAALFIRSEIYKKVGGLDGNFFAHMEEIDLCWRIKNRGFRIVCHPSSVVYHVGGATLSKSSSRKLHLNFRNNLYMLYKNLPSEKLLPTMLLRMMLDGVAAVKFLVSLEFDNFMAILKAHFSFYSNLSKMREKRRILNPLVSKEIHKEIYKGSIISDYFIHSKKKFSDITF
ncbi:glycosyltransferase family 2 protein [Ancylomarina sp. 16SWW S1-10-2]|uniref:glycosyltransferase family 2 protein n=1 Tax=Ancylomarina sp. 16SWW S1-10-2 TaxID=2499681 RepID=UPI0012AD59D5|nr:glycosyltransferase family 2 protein [Ancylomarina sp. 16SWW S1-10-2]MRT91790.1 glycosyltransferase family 2 protein [Ancylomarina sp. 16SWW S1-10-2]